MGPLDLTIVTEERQDGVVILVAGEIDLLTSTQLKRALDRRLDRSPPPARVTLDLAGVTFMDTTGVALLLATRARADEVGSRLVVSTASPSLTRLFAISGIDRMLLEGSR